TPAAATRHLTSACSNLTPHLPSPPTFPTRRSSDLRFGPRQHGLQPPSDHDRRLRRRLRLSVVRSRSSPALETRGCCSMEPPRARYEGHTSELPSLTNIRCRLLLAKKKTRRSAAHHL